MIKINCIPYCEVEEKKKNQILYYVLGNGRELFYWVKCVKNKIILFTSHGKLPSYKGL